MLKIALMGCGRIAGRHSDLLGHGEVAGAELAAVCDVDMSKAKLIGEKFGVPYYQDIGDLLETENVDAVSILTESGNHARDSIRVASYGKHIIVEKPMALTLSDADEMIRECDKNGVRLFVVKQNRFNLPIRKLREALDAGRFGKLIMGTVRVRWCRPQAYYDQAKWRGTWLMDGGVLTNQASHHVDLLTWMMGDVESVFAKGMTALADIEAEDTAVVILKFKSGALGVIEATTATRPRDLEGSLSILGEYGSVEVGGFAVNEMRHWDFVDSTEEDNLVKSEYSVNPPNVYGFGHHEYYGHVVDALSFEGPNLVDGLEGRRSLEVINAIYESIETGKEVRLRFDPMHVKLGREA